MQLAITALEVRELTLLLLHSRKNQDVVFWSGDVGGVLLHFCCVVVYKLVSGGAEGFCGNLFISFYFKK